MAYVPQDVLDRIAALERQVRQLAGRANIRPALNQVLNGDVVIGEGGQLMVRSETGVQHLTVGDLNTHTGETEYGTIIRRRDGSTALSIYNGHDAEQPQVLRLLDAQGHGLLVEDVTAGGLYKPWIPYPTPINEDISTWPKTSETTWTTVARSNAIFQHPRMSYFLSAAGGAVGQSRILVGGQVMVTSPDKAPAIAGIAEVPGYSYDMNAAIEIQLRVTAGPATVYIRPRYLYGVGSA